MKPYGIVAVLAAAAGMSSVLQPVKAGAEEVITVTARRVEENLQEVPIAVSTFSDRDLARRGMFGLADIAAFTPGLSFEDFSGPLETPVIRGQTQTRVQNPVQNVSTFLDGMYLQRSYMIDVGVIGLERVEVVKGPQSALYGQNSFAGAINYLPKKPTESFEADVMVDFGSDEFRMGSVSVAGPIFSDSLLGRFTWGRQQFDGTWNNAHPLAGAGIDPGTEDKLGGYDNETMSANLTVLPFDNVSLELGYYRNDLFQESMPAFTRLGRDGVGFFGFYDQNTLNCSSTPVNGPPFLGSGNGLWCGEFPTTTPPGGGDGGDIIRDPRTYGQESSNELATVRLTWNVNDAWEAVYLFGYADSDVRGAGQNIPDAIQGSGNPAAFLPPPGGGGLFPGLVPIGTTVGELEARQHEFRVNYVPGGLWEASLGLFFYESDDLSSSPAYFVPPLDATPIPELPVPNAAFTAREDETAAIFGRLGLNFLDGRLRASVEGRYSFEDKSIATVGDPSTARSDSFEFFTPRFTLDYALTDDNLLYLSLARGAKAGGFNDPFIGTPPVPIDPSQNTYDEETNWTYEVGAKNTFLDGRLVANVAVFYIDWEDLQINVPALNAPPGIVPVVIGNLGGVTTWGIEVDGVYRPVDPLSFDFALSYNDPTFDDGIVDLDTANSGVCDGVVCPANGDIGGNNLNRTPKVQAALGAQWVAQLTGDWDYYLRGDVTYQSKQYLTFLNVGYVPDRTLVNARVGLTSERWDISLWSKNLFDEEYVSNSLILGPLQAYTPNLGPLRQWGVNVTFAFGGDN